MSRTADYTIQGFLYQFNKTLLEVLNSADGTEITVEGIVEDIEVKSATGLTAIQCKYHETKTTFTCSVLYKPLLEMLKHFHENAASNIRYILFAHFPGSPAVAVTKDDLLDALKTKNKDLTKIADALRDKVDLDTFLTRFEFQVGESYDQITENVCQALANLGIPDGDIKFLAYPNAINSIANLSIKHDPSERRLTKVALLKSLKDIKTTVISRWTLALKTRGLILKARRQQLKTHLSINARLRYFIIHCDALTDFETACVGFIRDLINKYHFKTAHTETPLFCLETSDAIFQELQPRLFNKGIVTATGMIGTEFNKKYFFRKPLSMKGSTKGQPQFEFSLRLLRMGTNDEALSDQSADDIFVLGDGSEPNLNTTDVSVERLGASNLKEISYLLGISDTYE